MENSPYSSCLLLHQDGKISRKCSRFVWFTSDSYAIPSISNSLVRPRLALIYDLVVFLLSIIYIVFIYYIRGSTVIEAFFVVPISAPCTRYIGINGLGRAVGKPSFEHEPSPEVTVLTFSLSSRSLLLRSFVTSASTHLRRTHVRALSVSFYFVSSWPEAFSSTCQLERLQPWFSF